MYGLMCCCVAAVQILNTVVETVSEADDSVQTSSTDDTAVKRPSRKSTGGASGRLMTHRLL